MVNVSEITKLYENAGVERRRYCEFDDDCPLMFSHPCSECDEKLKPQGYVYPPFTAEKQLKILCFIVNNKHRVTFHDQVFGGDKLTLEKIQEDLGWAINRIWQDLTEEEKQQIKEMLE